jgi:Kef-type K+ transport system membrane component KefB
MFKIVSTLIALCSSLIAKAFGMGSNTAPVSIPAGVLTASGIPASFVAHFALFIAFVLLWTLLSGVVFKQLFRLPIIAGQILGGILLGPSLLNIRSYAIFSQPLTMVDAATNIVYTLPSFDLFVFTLILISSTLTVSYLLWIAGHETDVRDLVNVGFTATTAGILGALVPIAMTVLAVIGFGYTVVQAIGMGLIFAATSVSIPVAMLVSQKKMHLKSSKATLGAAIIDDVFAVILLSLFFIFFQQEVGAASAHHAASIWTSLSYMMGAGIGIFLTGHYIVPRVLAWLETHHYAYLIASLASGMMLLYFAFAELIGGLAGITGAYFIGLFHKKGDAEHRAEHAITPYVNSFLLPLFLASIGLQLDMSILTLSQWGIVLLLLVVAIVSKLIGCWAATAMSNKFTSQHDQWGSLETYLFGASMVARGEVGLVVSTILRGASWITAEQYTIAVMVIVLTTIATPILLAIGFAIQESEPEVREAQAARMSKNIGYFNQIGTEQMFDIMVGVLEHSKTYKTSVYLSEGCRIVTIEGDQVKIVMNPDEGITVEGNPELIHAIIAKVQEAIKGDMGRLSGV